MPHPLRELRDRVTAVLESAAITIDVGGASQGITVLRNPPESGLQNDSALPGIYMFAKSERIAPNTMRADQRDVELDFVLQAKGSAGDAVDQIDAMQLALEVAMAQDHTLGGLSFSFRPTGSRIQLIQGEVVFAARVVTFLAQIIAPRTNPEITQ